MNPRNPGSNLRIIFGTPEFAEHILRFLVDQGERVVAVVTTPDKQSGRGMKRKRSAVREAAIQLSLPVLMPAKHRDPEFIAHLRQLNADVFVVAAYKILPKEVFIIPRLGAFNVHASLLPRYRGAAPINWAVIRGERETGITTFLLEEKVDTGKMLLAKSIPIGADETVGELHDRLMRLGAEATLETLQGLASGGLHPQKQSSDLVTDAPKIFPKDCIIDFNQSTEKVHNFIRGLSPHPGATTMLANGIRLKILRTKIDTDANRDLGPGEFRVSSEGKRLFVGTAAEGLEIVELQREGKRSMRTEEFLRGNISFFHS